MRKKAFTGGGKLRHRGIAVIQKRPMLTKLVAPAVRFVFQTEQNKDVSLEYPHGFDIIEVTHWTKPEQFWRTIFKLRNYGPPKRSTVQVLACELRKLPICLFAGPVAYCKP